MNYDPEEVSGWKMLLGYDDENGNIRILYNIGLRYYLYIHEEDRMERLKSSYHLAVFYRLIDEINHVIYITKDTLDYLTRNAYLMNHFPTKSQDLTAKMFEYIDITGANHLLEKGSRR